MKRAVVIALMALGATFAGQSPAKAAALGMSSVGAPLSNHAADHRLAPAGFNGCWWDMPVLGAGVAFFELLRDEEVDRHCDRHDYEVSEPALIAPEPNKYLEESPKYRKDYLSPK